MRKKLIPRLVVAAVVLTLVAALIFWHSLISLAENFVGDVKPRCSMLPAAAVASGKEPELKAFNDEVVRVTQGVGGAGFDTQRCPGRVEVHVYYGSEADKPKLMELWQNSQLRSIPVHWQNI